MRTLVAGILLFATLTSTADELPFVSDKVLADFAAELSGESAKRTVEGISRSHRMRASKQYHDAAQLIVGELKRYGFDDAAIVALPVDGETFYGTQRSRPAWNPSFAELWELRGEERTRLASFDAAPITLAQDSASGELTTSLVDIGAGTSEKDYAGKDIRGKLVLTSSQPSAVVPLAIGTHGAAGIVSYAQNQRTAWYGENDNLVRWGHLDTFSPHPAFGFMISLRTARELQRRLAAGEAIQMHAIVRTERSAGSYDIAMATIPGTDTPAQEVIFSCHLDHPRPGANDNASGCATILEVARTMRKLISEGRLSPPRRTIRFVFPPEIEGTIAMLNARPAIARSAIAAVHLDMVGGGPETKAMFHVTRGATSLPSWIHDVAESVGLFVNRHTAEFASTGTAKFPLVSPTGGKEALQARMVPLTLGSDHTVYSDSSFRIPAIYLNDWPDRYIHTNHDLPANIDPTKLQRAAFIAGVSGYVVANATSTAAGGIWQSSESAAMRRAADALATGDARAKRVALWYDRGIFESLRSLGSLPPQLERDATAFLTRLEALLPSGVPPRASGAVYRRRPEPKGPMSAFGYDYFEDKFGEEKTRTVALLHHRGARGGGGEYAYEALNLVDGRRSASEITDMLSGIYGEVPQNVVEEYLQALESIGVLEKVK